MTSRKTHRRRGRARRVAGRDRVAVAAVDKAPARTTIKVSQSFKLKPNRYVQDGLRWNRDVYRVRSGGTLHVVNTAADEGPHTFTVVRQVRPAEDGGRGVQLQGLREARSRRTAPIPTATRRPSSRSWRTARGRTAPNVDRPATPASPARARRASSST